MLLSGLLMLRIHGLHLITKMGMNQCISTITDMRVLPINKINWINYKHIITYFNQQNNPSSFEHTTSLYVIKFCCSFIMLAQLLKNTFISSVYTTHNINLEQNWKMTEKFGTNLRLNIRAYLTENVTPVFWEFLASLKKNSQNDSTGIDQARKSIQRRPFCSTKFSIERSF